MEKTQYHIRITLLGCDPKIWRLVAVDADLDLEEVHLVIQDAMGWENCHMFKFTMEKSFRKPGLTYPAEFDMDLFELWEDKDPSDAEQEMLDSIPIPRLSDWLNDSHKKIYYDYDFGDGWQHEITLKKKVTVPVETPVATYLDGAMACPPEDCGGVYGYMEMMELRQNPQEWRKSDFYNWLDPNFKQDFVDVEEIKERLSEIGQQ